jgi:putative tricarboxylic transport membrane protein
LDRVSGLLLLLLGLLIFWEGRAVPFGSIGAPGPLFFPLVLGIMLVFLGLVLLVRKPDPKEKGGGSAFDWPGILRRLLPVFAGLVVYVYLLEPLGFLIAGIALMTFLFLNVASQKWPTAFLGAFVSIGLAYLLFGVLMKSNLPRGPLGF